MKSWILGLSYLFIGVLAIGQYQQLKAEDIDAELEALEQTLNSRKVAAFQKRTNDFLGRNLGGSEDFTDEELQEQDMIQEDDADVEKQKLEPDFTRKRGWGRFRFRGIRIRRILKPYPRPLP